jgi:hypothetical protein
VTVNDYLDAVIAALGCKNDAELARRLRFGHSRLSSYRSGKVFPKPTLARVIARKLRVSPQTVINDIRQQKLSKRWVERA